MAATLALADAAAAGVRATVTVSSDDRFRGRSISQDRPTAGIDVTYDASSGLYAGLAATAVVARHDGVQLLGAQEYAGYVVRLTDGPSVDLGVTHSNYTEYYNGLKGTGYTEVYAGLITNRFSTRLYYSPNYFGRGTQTLYGEVNTAVRPARSLRLTAHAGVLTYLSGQLPPSVKPTQFDWRLGLATAIRSFEVEFSWSGARPTPEAYGGAPRGHSGVALALRRTF
jgi:uncharacterized protein (TIGR02001 family)